LTMFWGTFSFLLTASGTVSDSPIVAAAGEVGDWGTGPKRGDCVGR
jgi:hypothetical protein